MNLVEYSEFLVKSICKDPELVKVTEHETESDGKILDILIPLNSAGSVIGKDGRNAKSLRILISAYAYIHNLGNIKVKIDTF